MKKLLPFIIILTFVTLSTYAQQTELLKLTGPYLGQKPPGNIPEIFAPGIVSTEKNEHSAAIFSKDGNELFWSYYTKGNHIIMFMKQEKDGWTKPAELLKNCRYRMGNPFFSADWTKLIYFSDRKEKRDDGTLNIDFWYMEKQDDVWCNAQLLIFLPNSNKWQLNGCQTANGNFYFTSKVDEKNMEFQLYISTYNGKNWEPAKPLDDCLNESAINWTPYVSPDESYIIFSSDREGVNDGFNACDLFISFKDHNNKWITPINMGCNINTNELERFPWVSPDGKYLFFVRGQGDIYWVSTDIIENLRPKI